MSERYEEQCDGGDAICPYCKATFQPEAEDYSEDSREIECDECGKKYWLHQSFTVDHWTKPDCALNGEAHVWDSRARFPDSHFCEVCGKCERRATMETERGQP